MKTEPNSEHQELIFDGVGVAAGIAIGPAHVVESGALNVPEYRIKRNQVTGEMAGDPRYTALLLGLGIRELSMSPATLLRVKERVRALDLMASIRRSDMIMDQVDSNRIELLLDDFNELT